MQASSVCLIHSLIFALWFVYLKLYHPPMPIIKYGFLSTPLDTYYLIYSNRNLIKHGPYLLTVDNFLVIGRMTLKIDSETCFIQLWLTNYNVKQLGSVTFFSARPSTLF